MSVLKATVFDDALIAGHTRSIVRTRRRRLWLAGADGWRRPVPYADWCRSQIPGDEALLSRCAGPTLDIGCGPGRLAAALTRRGVPALGIDISAESVSRTRDRGALALQRDVFEPLPAEGRWQTVILADGNVGIGGNPVGLLSRCRHLLATAGVILVEVAGPQTPTWCGAARWETCRSRSPWFAWAVLSLSDVAAVADGSGLVPLRTWQERGRWFAALGALLVA